MITWVSNLRKWPPTLLEILSDRTVEWGTSLGSPLVLTSVILNDSWNVATTEPSHLSHPLPRIQLSPSLMRDVQQMLEEVGACAGPNPKCRRTERGNSGLQAPFSWFKVFSHLIFCLVISGTSFKKKKKYQWILQVVFYTTESKEEALWTTSLGPIVAWESTDILKHLSLLTTSRCMFIH